MKRFEAALCAMLWQLGRGLALFAITVVEAALVAIPLSAIVVPTLVPAILLHGTLIGAFLWLWLIPGLLISMVGGRQVLRVHRRLVERWCGGTIPAPYRPRPAVTATEHGWYWNGYDYHKYRWFSKVQQRGRWLFADPATWRDTIWQAFGLVLGGLPAILPTVAVGVAALAIARLFGVERLAPLFGDSYPLAGAVAGGCLAGGLSFAHYGVALHGRVARALLAPTRRASLEQRVDRLTETRTDATEAQAAELRRIERDLHDGAQARLVAMGLTLGAIDRLLDTNPVAARELLAKTRDASAQALAELRDLVRGIHPPVLAERGLADAVRALALDSPLPVVAEVTLTGRAPEPIESAAYFAISETLTNVAKHAAADHVTLTLSYREGVLRVDVADDGRGGADDSGGTGLRGIRRRLGTFDGTLTLDSPVGGPTRVTMEIPCALSSPRTSTSSERA